MLRNTKESYGSIAKFFHWLIALLVIIMLFVGYLMDSATVANVHKLVGLTILVLVIARIIWVLNNERPLLPATVNKFERILSHSVQGLLYVSLLLMPLSGWAMATAFGYFPHLGAWYIPMPGIPIDHSLAEVFEDIHATTALFLIAFVCLHALGALKHHFWDKDAVLRNMLPTTKKPQLEVKPEPQIEV